MSDFLGPVLGAEVEWPATDNPIPDSPMARCFAETSEIHKNDTYIPVYNTTFAPYRDDPIRILEIGVSRGGSLKMWRKYFTHPNTVIVGIDFNKKCAMFEDPPRHVHVRIGRQQDTAFLQSVIDELGPFDIILDDGSHLPSPTLASFQYLFVHGLVDGGVYLVEDLWFCYMPVGQEDGEDPIGQVMNPELSGCPPFTEVVKYLIDVMHRVWVGHNTAFDGSADQVLFGVDSPHRIAKHLVPLATTLISSIEIHDSIAVIHRQPHDVPRVLMKVTGHF